MFPPSRQQCSLTRKSLEEEGGCAWKKNSKYCVSCCDRCAATRKSRLRCTSAGLKNAAELVGGGGAAALQHRADDGALDR